MKNLWIAALALFPSSVFAVDGVVLINQSTVAAAGGFPYTISQPGSYKLSGNLVVPANTNGISITASNVTLDLAGFSITAPTGAQLPSTTGIVAASTATGVAIRNGAIRGFTFPILAAYTNNYWILEELVLDWPTGGSGTNFGMGTLIRHITAFNMSFTVSCPSLIVNSVVGSAGVDIMHPGLGNCAFSANATQF